MFKPVSELEEKLTAIKAERVAKRDDDDRKLIEKLMDEAYAKAEKITIATEEDDILAISFEIDHYISIALHMELQEAGWQVTMANGKVKVSSK